jgi:hypothetical protein
LALAVEPSAGTTGSAPVEIRQLIREMSLANPLLVGFRRITAVGRAPLGDGACRRFNPGAAHQLGEMLRAVAAYASGGLNALERCGWR